LDGAANSGALGFDTSDPDLVRLLAAWAALPQTVKAEIMALVQAASPSAVERPARPSRRAQGERSGD
jgi:hypothetical protein